MTTKRRGICSVCLREYAVVGEGVMRDHWSPLNSRVNGDWQCPGAGRPPVTLAADPVAEAEDRGYRRARDHDHIRRVGGRDPVTTPPIPAEMIEALARKLCNLRNANGHDSWADLKFDDSRNAYRAQAQVLLAAAFEGCEIREEVDFECGALQTRGAVKTRCEHWMPTGNYRQHRKLLRRLVIISPAEQVDTEGATT